MKLRRKLLVAMAPAVVTLAALGAYGARMIETLGGEAENILRANYKSIRAMQRLTDGQDDLEGALLAGATPADIDSRLAGLRAPLDLQLGNLTEPGEAEATTALEAALERWSEAARRAAAATGQARVGQYHAALRPASDEVRSAVGQVVELNQEAIVRKSRETTALADRLRQRVVLLSLAAFGALVTISALAAARLSRPIVELTRAVRALAQGDLEHPLPEVVGDDELAVLVAEVGRMTGALREYRRSSLGELIAAQQLAQAAIDSLRDPVVSFGPDRRVRQVNDAAARLLRVDPDAPDPLAGLPAELRAGIELARDRVLAGKGAVVPDGLAGALPAMVQGTARQVQLHATPTVRRGAGEIVGATVLVRDVTSLHAAAALKDDLLSTVAHELRTPLTSLRMAVHMLLEQAAGPVGEKQQELLAAAREDAERLHALVEGILSVARLEEGGLAARRRPWAPAELVEAVVAPARLAAADKHVTLDLDAPQVPTCLVDRDGAIIALGNFVQNALRHTPEGGRISVRAAPDPSGKAVRFEVKDTGEGIAPEHHARLFSRFYRLPGSPPGGTGLGLSITRDVVHAHGGEIGVESAPGQGSTFWLTLPTAKEGSTSGVHPRLEG